MMIRAAYRRTLSLWKLFDRQFGLPNIVTMPHLMMKRLLTSPDGIKSRISLINIWLLEETDTNDKIKSLLFAAILDVNEFVHVTHYPFLKHVDISPKKREKNRNSYDKDMIHCGRRGISKSMLSFK